MPQYQGVWTLEQQAQALTNQQWVTDPNFKNTTLLLQADGTGSGSQNQTFLDGSTNNFFITRYSNTTQGSFSPFSQAPGYWSNYFTGTSGLTTNSNAGMGVTSGGDVTIEVWLNTFTTATNEGLGDSGNSICGTTDEAAWNSTSYGIILNSTGICLYNGNGGGVLWSMACSINDGRWHHVAVVRASGTWQTFIDGRSIGTTTTQGTRVLGSDTYKYAVGTVAPNGASGAFLGYLSNFRFTKAAVYTSAFTPQTTPFTAITNTSLLTLQSNRFVDNSSSPKTFTVYGSPSVQAFGPFAPALQWTPDVVGGSGYFDGTDDYLSLNDASNNLDLGGINASIAFFINPTSSNAKQIITKGGGVADWNLTNGFEWQISWFSGSLRLGYNNAGSNADLTFAVTAVPNQWYHIAIATDTSNNISLYLNGTRVGTATNGISKPTNRATVNIANDVSANYFPGYMSGLSFISGSGAYNPTSTTITIPTVPPTNVANTKLLMNFTNAGIYDGKMGNVFETKGNAQVATNPVKYGSGSMYFDGTAAALLPPASKLLAFGTGDFTVEVWVWPIAWDSNMVVIQGGSNGFGIQKYSSGATGNIGVIINGGWVITDAFLPITGQWSHIAVTRTNGVLRFFVNGSVTGSSPANTADIADGIKNVGGEAGQTYFKGYMDDIRVTKGVCRYIANFTPPQQALPRQ
jgi:hypothetical protein